MRKYFTYKYIPQDTPKGSDRPLMPRFERDRELTAEEYVEVLEAQIKEMRERSRREDEGTMSLFLLYKRTKIALLKKAKEVRELRESLVLIDELQLLELKVQGVDHEFSRFEASNCEAATNQATDDREHLKLSAVLKRPAPSPTRERG